MSQEKCTVLGQPMAEMERMVLQTQSTPSLDRNLKMVDKTQGERVLLVPDAQSKQENWRVGLKGEVTQPRRRPNQSEWRPARREGAGGAGWSSSSLPQQPDSLGMGRKRGLEDDWRRGRGVVCCLPGGIFPRPWHLHGSESSKGSLCNRLLETPY